MVKPASTYICNKNKTNKKGKKNLPFDDNS